MALTEKFVRVGSAQFAVYETSASQVSTNSYALVLGFASDSFASDPFEFDMASFRSIQLSMHAEVNGVAVALFGASGQGFADEELAYEWPVVAGHTEHQSVPTIKYRYYRAKIKSTLADNPGTMTMKAIASQNRAEDIYWDTISVQPTSAAGGSPLVSVDYGPVGAGRPKALGFTVGKEASGSLQFNHRFRELTDITFHVHWAPTSNGVGAVRWQLAYYWQNVHEDVTGPPVVLEVEQVTSGAPWLQQIGVFADLPGSNKKIGSTIMFRLARVTSVGAKYKDPVCVTTVDAHFQVDSPGSRQLQYK